MNYEYCPPISKRTICFWSVKIKANFSCCLKHCTDFGEDWMYDHHHDFCRRNFLDPQQVWNELVSWCWDAAFTAGPAECTPALCLISSVPTVPMKLTGLFMCLILSLCSVSCWSGTSLGSSTSHVSAFHCESHSSTKWLTGSLGDKCHAEYLRY